MLNIVTGLPGACKTLYTLSKILPQYRGRQVYVHGIPGIDHEHFGTLPLEDPEKWYELPEGSVVIMDEAQGVFPLRRAGSQVPMKCSQFETHRHKGFDVVLITQDATTLDVHVRKLAGQHIHCRRLFGSNTSTIFIYGKHQPKPEDRNTIKTAISNKMWTFDKTVYDHYKSADIHTVKRKIPMKLIMVPFLVAAAIGAVLFAISTVASMFENDAEMLTDASQSAFGIEMDGMVTETSKSPAEDWLIKRTPVVEGMPWTAPIYDEVATVAAFPKPHCIIQEVDGGTRCRCYSQQITYMKNVKDEICYQLAVDGWFDPTVADRSNRDRAQRDPVRRTPDRRPTTPLRVTASAEPQAGQGNDSPGRALRPSYKGGGLRPRGSSY